MLRSGLDMCTGWPDAVIQFMGTNNKLFKCMSGDVLRCWKLILEKCWKELLHSCAGRSQMWFCSANRSEEEGARQCHRVKIMILKHDLS